jgi:hypothetical protein
MNGSSPSENPSTREAASPRSRTIASDTA